MTQRFQAMCIITHGMRDWQTTAQSNTAKQRDNEIYRKNEDSEGDSYTLILRQEAGNDSCQYFKQLKKEQIKLDKTFTQANMLAAFPLITASDMRWWSHWRSLESPDTSTTFFARPLKKGRWTWHTHQWLNCNWLKVVIALGFMTFLGFCRLRFCCCKTCLSGTL